MNCLKANIFTTIKQNCGISSYSQFLFNELSKKIDAQIIENTEKNFSQLAEKAKNADIVHVQFEPGAFGSMAMLKGTSIPEFFSKLSNPKKAKVVTTIHEMNESPIRGIKSLFVNLYQKHINSFVFKNSDSIIVHSRKLEELAKKYSKNVVFMPHGAFESQKMVEKETAKQSLGLKGKTVLTIFGFVEPRKQHAKIINLLPELDENIVLVIAGKSATSNYESQLKELCRQKNLEKRVVFTGFVEEKGKPMIFCATDLMLYPYKDIYQSGSMNEALSYRKPILASDIEGFSELKKFECIETSKENEWKQKILQLLKDKKKQQILEKKAANYCSQNSWKKTAERTIELYENLLNA